MTLYLDIHGINHFKIADKSQYVIQILSQKIGAKYSPPIYSPKFCYQKSFSIKTQMNDTLHFKVYQFNFQPINYKAQATIITQQFIKMCKLYPNQTKRFEIPLLAINKDQQMNENITYHEKQCGKFDFSIRYDPVLLFQGQLDTKTDLSIQSSQTNNSKLIKRLDIYMGSTGGKSNLFNFMDQGKTDQCKFVQSFYRDEYE